MKKRRSMIIGLITLILYLTLYSCGNKQTLTETTTTTNSTTTETMTTTTENELDDSLILWYQFNENSGTNVSDSSTYGNDGTLYNATWTEDGAVELNGENGYVKMPDGILDGIEDITIIIEVYIDASNENPFWIYTFGSALDAGSMNAKYLGLLNDGSNVLRQTLSTNRWTAEQNTVVPYPMVKGIWTQFAYTLDGSIGKLYQDGINIATNYNVTIEPDTIEHTIANYIGKPAYINDRYFKGIVKDFKIYQSALDEETIEAISSVNNESAVNLDYEHFTLENIDAVENDITLPSRGEYGSYITWTSTNTSYITNDGKITRPAHEEGNQTIELIAQIKKGDFMKTKSFQASVLAEYSDEEKLLHAKEKLTIPNHDDIRGNITLISTIDDGIEITWQSNNEDVISTTSNPAGVVTRQSTDTVVKLTATLRLNGKTENKEIDVIVKAIPEEPVYSAYLFAYFTGEYKENGEQIYFGTSRDGLNWQALNQNTPVLESNVGEIGVRDPFILRSPEGDKFYMIATDLSINKNGDWWRAQSRGSKSIVVWESTDLVNWTEPRLVEVARDDAGCTWAPEFIYDEATGEYVVYWASRTASDNYAKQRIYIAKTRDFYTFTEPVVYVERGNDVIDTTMIYQDGVYYRFAKDETSKRVTIDTSTELFGEFTPLPSEMLSTQAGVEGPLIFKMNDQDKWVLFLDAYGAGGYYPLITTDISSGVFNNLSSSEYQLPQGARHGSVIPITEAEYQALQDKWSD